MSALYNYTVKYKTFDQLLEELNIDLASPSMSKTIEPQTLIKVARKVNYDLGLRIERTSTEVIDVMNYKAKLPENFSTLNFALLCGSYTVTTPVIQGTQVEEVIVNQGNCGSEEDCTVPYTCLNDCGGYVQLIQRFKTETRTYSQTFPLQLSEGKNVECTCPNTKMRSPNQGYIKDGYLYVSFETGTVFIDYQTTMEDEQGNLLVVDHPLINEYYEYALKERIYENRLLNGDVGQETQLQLQLLASKLLLAKRQAMSLVNTPNFAELKKIWEINRKAYNHKYVDMFKSYNLY